MKLLLEILKFLLLGILTVLIAAIILAAFEPEALPQTSPHSLNHYDFPKVKSS